jgi:pimeloyl-ACP methyl ester carboxylesterase
LLLIVYFTVILISLRFYLSDFIFKNIEHSQTSETQRYSIKHGNNELIIRHYKPELAKYCAIFFPGRSGNISRYEKEIFKHALARNISIFAISFPGYDGAEGKSSYKTVLTTGKTALEYINDSTSCKISESVFIARSLGAMVAVKLAEYNKPKGFLLDSVAVSLSSVIGNHFKNNPYLWLGSLLPLANIMEYDPKLSESMDLLTYAPVVIFQGEHDALTPYKDIHVLSERFNNIELVKVINGSHSDAHKKEIDLYINKLETLFVLKNE